MVIQTRGVHESTLLTYQDATLQDAPLRTSSGSLMARCVDMMLAHMDDTGSVPPPLWMFPSLWMIQQVRQEWHRQGGSGVMPPMVTYAHPLRYTVSARYDLRPVSVAKALAWTLTFLDHHQEGADRKTLLSGLAYDIIHVWERTEQSVWHQWEENLASSGDDVALCARNQDPSLPPWPMDESLPYATMGTLPMVHQWWSWWPGWLAQNGYCSQAAASGRGRQVLARDIAKGKPVMMVTDHRSTLPWGWIRQWHHCPHVTYVSSDALSESAPNDPQTSQRSSVPSPSILQAASGGSIGEETDCDPSRGADGAAMPSPPCAQRIAYDESRGDDLGRSGDCEDCGGADGTAMPSPPCTQGLGHGAVHALSAHTLWEQSRLMACVVNHLLTSSPHDIIGLSHQDPQGLTMTVAVLQGYGWSVSLPQHPLIASLFMALWRAVMWHHTPVDDGGTWLWDILGHPLVLKRYPVVRSMERWIRRYGIWPTLAAQKMMSESSRAKPVWMRRMEDVMNHVWLMCQPWEGDSGQPRCLSLWLKAHVQAVDSVVPHEWWDHSGWLRLLVHEMHSPHHPLMTAHQYESWMTTWFSTIYHQPTKGCERIVVGSCEELSALGLHQVVVGHDQEVRKPYPWLPSWCLGPLGIERDPPVLLPVVAPGGHIWQVSVVPDQGDTGPFVGEDSVQKPLLIQRSDQIFQASAQVDSVWLPPSSSDQRHCPGVTHVTISDIQRWRQDPQRFYRESLLKIKSQEVTQQQVWGMAIHTIMEHVVRSCPVSHGYTVGQLADAMKELAAVYVPPMVWWKQSLLDDMWEQAAEMEYAMRQGVVAVLTEVSGKWDVQAPNGETCRLWGRADRLNIRADGSVDVIDYKTGAVPSFVAMERFESVQLPLEAWLVTKGGMAPEVCGAGRGVSGLAWWSFHWRKGCDLKRYPRCVPSLVACYDEILPVWAQQLLSGDYLSSSSLHPLASSGPLVVPENPR